MTIAGGDIPMRLDNLSLAEYLLALHGPRAQEVAIEHARTAGTLRKIEEQKRWHCIIGLIESLTHAGEPGR